MNNLKFGIFKSTVSFQFYFLLRASNGKTILSGREYPTKQACQVGILAVKTNALSDIHYKRNYTSNQFTFSLHGTNGEVIGRSDDYSSIAAREIDIEAVKWDASHAATEIYC